MPAKTNGTALITENKCVFEKIFRMRVRWPHGAGAGQFFMVRAWEDYPLLGRPLSVCDCDGGVLTFLYEVRGGGTKLLSEKAAGEKLTLTGPLGNGFPVEKISGKVALVAGGIGLAPFVFTARRLKECDITLFCGFRRHGYELDAFKPFVRDIRVATDSGLEGYRGPVTDLLNPGEFDFVLSCGPGAMMEKVASACRENRTPCYLSLERHMACGVGACLGCTCRTYLGARSVCKDGPVFKGEEIYA